MALNLAIIHHHLSRGGVTQVVANHLQSLSMAGAGDQQRVALIHGGRCNGWPVDLACQLKMELSTHVVPQLEYDERQAGSAGELADRLRRLFEEIGFIPHESVVHVHNHSLGKNTALPTALARLAGDGFRLLLHIHDFAEDFRPDNYRQLVSELTPNDARRLPNVLYPQAGNIHYAVLNGRDFRVLSEAGVDDTRLHLLPNPVPGFIKLPNQAEARRKLAREFGVLRSDHYLLYPVRGIRRKNLGEAALWSVLAGKNAAIGCTLPPLNPLEKPSYRSWKQFARSQRLRCVFETGTKMLLEENFAASDLILTTSVAEGFGMAFLESWQAGRRLVGRDLPEVTEGLVASGMEFRGLSSQVKVPAAWLDAVEIRSAIVSAYSHTCAAYGRRPAPQRELDHELRELMEGGTIDFAILPSAMQKQIIAIANADPARANRLLQLNPWLEASLTMDEPQLIERNASVVRERYSLKVAGERLRKLYETIAAGCGENASRFEGQRVLDAFLDPLRLHLIRLER